MGFPLEVLQSGIKVADALTKGVQSTIQHYPWTGQTGDGDETYGTAVARKCVLDMTRRQVKRDGRLVTVVATLTFVGDILPNGSAGRHEPIDPRDKIVLPDGSTGPILSAPDAVSDPSTGRGLIHVVMIGEL